jgi:hypothetical protein
MIGLVVLNPPMKELLTGTRTQNININELSWEFG